MADKNIVKAKKAERRRRRVRGKVIGNATRPRLTVTKSLQNVFAQLVDDENHVTLAAAASNSKEVKGELKDEMTKTDVAKLVGEKIAGLAKEKGIETVVFDRNQNRFHGRIKAVADGAKAAGLKI
ncbi:MAG: 50S ribosomal protein L18 [bacterium]|nr:50S ribosomal protein L18 [bacterium]